MVRDQLVHLSVAHDVPKPIRAHDQVLVSGAAICQRMNPDLGLTSQKLFAIDARRFDDEVVVPDAPGHAHRPHQATQLAPTADDRLQSDVVQRDVPGAPALHVKVTIQDIFAHVVVGHASRQDVAVVQLLLGHWVPQQVGPLVSDPLNALAVTLRREIERHLFDGVLFGEEKCRAAISRVCHVKFVKYNQCNQNARPTTYPGKMSSSRYFKLVGKINFFLVSTIVVQYFP